MNKWYWEDVSDLAGADKAITGGFWAAIFVAGVTTLFVTLSLAGVHLFGIGLSALVDAGLFAAIAIGIKQKSRFAAVAGLCLYIIERIYMLKVTGAGGMIMAVFLVLLFINAVRGTFAYHRLSAQPQTTASTPIA